MSSHQLPLTKRQRVRITKKDAANGCSAKQTVSIDHVSKEIGSSLLAWGFRFNRTSLAAVWNGSVLPRIFFFDL